MNEPRRRKNPLGHCQLPLALGRPSFHPINWDAWSVKGMPESGEYPAPFGTHGDARSRNAMPSQCPPRNYIWALCQGTCIKIQLRVLNAKNTMLPLALALNLFFSSVRVHGVLEFLLHTL